MARLGGDVEVTSDPMEAATGADALYTDVWTSMGQEEEQQLRRKAFAGFTIDEAMVGRAAPDAVVLHCLPAHRGEEISAEVLDGPRSVVWRQAANRMHAVRGLLAWLLGPPGGRWFPVKMGKPQRQHRDRSGCSRPTPCPTRRQLVGLLAAEGVEATQATVSRDLEEIGAMKVRVPGGETVYALPELPVRPGRTRGPSPPGARRVGGGGGPFGQPRRAAHAARFGARGGLGARPGGLEGVIGTVAGDDTVLVVAAEEPVAGHRHRPELAGSPPPPRRTAQASSDRRQRNGMASEMNGAQ